MHPLRAQLVAGLTCVYFVFVCEFVLLSVLKRNCAKLVSNTLLATRGSMCAALCACYTAATIRCTALSGMGKPCHHHRVTDEQLLVRASSSCPNEVYASALCDAARNGHCVGGGARTVPGGGGGGVRVAATRRRGELGPCFFTCVSCMRAVWM